MKEWGRAASLRGSTQYQGAGLRLLIAIFSVILLIASFNRLPLARGQEQNPTSSIAQGELLLYYTYVTPPKQAPAGKGIDREHANAAAVVMSGLGIPAEQVMIEPLFTEIVDEMRSQNLTESLAILSLVKKYNTSSERFLTSPFFARIQTRSYTFTQVIVVKFPLPPKTSTEQIIDRILGQSGRHRASNLIITPLPISLTPVVGTRFESNGGALPEPLSLCAKAPPKVAIVGDQFVPRADLPQMTSLSITASSANGCDTTPYSKEIESYGTNMAGVIGRLCPTCQLIGLDAGCSRNSTPVLRSSDIMRGILSAVLRDVAVIVFTSAERNNDPLLTSVMNAALDARTLLVAPAGDRASTERHYPAANKGVFGVEATDAAGTRAPFSNRGPWVATSAVGVSVPTTHGAIGSISVSSTSIAAAQFSGLLARYLALNPKVRFESLPSLFPSKEFRAPSPQKCPDGSDPASTGGGSPSSGSPGNSQTGAPAGSTGGGTSPGSGSSSDTAGSGGAGNPPPPPPPPVDTADACPQDPAKTQPGLCGCGVADTDADGDAAPDCRDACPQDPGKTTSGTCGCGKTEGSCADGNDLCPADPQKTKPGICGCGTADEDTNKNDIIDCLENSQALGKSNNESPFDSEKVATTSNQANKVIASELDKEEKTLTQFLIGLGVPSSKAPSLTPESALVPKGTKINLVVDYARAATCRGLDTANAFADLFKSKEFAANVGTYAQAKLSVGAEPFSLPKDLTVAALRASITNTSCPGVIVGVTDPSDSSSKVYANGTFNDPGANRQRDYLEATKFEKAYEYFKKNSTSPVVVAFIDTGFDLAAKNRDVAQFSSIMVGANLVSLFDRDRSNPDLPQDTNGHGTMVASIAAAAENNATGTAGLAAGSIAVLPIRILRDASAEVGSARLVEGIRLAVNSGAKIVNISLNQPNRYYADPFVGEALFRAIEKGVTFIFAAGDGIEDENKVKFPIELKSPSDYGIQRFGRTMTPAAWGLYFKGALTVAGLETGRDTLYLKSNYGQSAELAAPATNITTVGLNGTITSGTGTSFAAPMVTAAAALVYSHFTTNKFRISPWLLEDILLNATPSRESLMTAVRNGRALDFEALKNYLTTLSQMSEEERAQIPSDNQDVGTGWDPERDIERVAEVLVDAPDASSLIAKGQSLQLRALVRYTDGSTQDVTNHPNIFWTVQYEPEGFTSITPTGGVVRVNPSAQLKPGDTIRVLAHYKTDYLGTFVLQLQEGDAQPAFTKLQIEVSSKGNGASGGSRITWGRTGVCKVLGSFTTSAGVEITTDLTQVAEIVSSKPEELPLDPSAKGLLRTTKTFGGSTYTLTARYKNLTAQAPVVIEKVQASLEIRNALGDPLRGQPVTVRAALVAPSLVDDIPIKADWGSTSPALTISRSNVSEITIMTEGLPTGSYSIQARTEFRGMGENTIITAQHTFAVLDSVMRMELLTKTPILSFQSRGVFVLRLYNRNNSYTVIDPRKITWSTSSPELRIDPQGVVTPTERSIKDGKITPYTVYGDYLGQRVSASIAISPTNTINGSQAQLSHIVINAEWGKCNTATQAPGCDRIVASGSMSRIGELQAIAYYSDGRTRDITRYATWSTSHPYMAKLLKASSKFDLRFGPESRPGDVVKLTAVYEGQQASHLITVLPVKDIVLAEPQLGATLEVDTSRKVLLPQPRIQAVDESGASGTVWGEVKKPLLWSSTDPRVLAAISGLNVPSSHNQDFLIDTSKLPPGNSYPISLTYTYEGYGLSKVLRGEYVLKNVEVQPVGLKLEVGYSEPRVSFRESVQSLTCYLEYPNRSPVDIPCSEVNLTFTLGENSSSATNITPEVYLGISDTRPLPRFISRRFRPTDFLIPTPENSDRVFTVQGTHKTLNFKSAPVSGYIFGIDRLAPETPPAALPTEEPLKADDPFCTEERRNLAPVAGGTGRPSDPFVVCTAQQLMNVSQAKRTGTGSGSVVSLRANLDFAGVSGLTPIKLNASTMSELGDVTLLLGNGYRISNITIIDRERDKVGIFAESIDVRDLIIDRAVVRGDTTVGILFGESGGEVVNVQILRSTVQGTSKVGAIAGAATRTHVKRVFIKDSQIAFEQGYAGCIFGTSSTRNFFGKLSGSIVDSVCTSTTINPVGVQGTQEAIGGLVGKFSGDEYLPDFLSPRGGKEIPITPSSAWLSKPNVHISNSHFSGTINAGLKAGSTGIGQSEVGGLVGVGVEVGIVQSSAKADITSIGSNVGGLVGSFDCESRDGGFGFLIGSSFEGSITGGQAVGGPSNAGGLVGTLDGSCMILRNRVSGTIRGRAGVGGLIGNSFSTHRYVGNEVTATVGSSIERHGAFIGSLATRRLGVYRIKDQREYVLEDIYQGNSWRYTGSGKAPQDVGTSDVKPDARGGLDVAGVDQR